MEQERYEIVKLLGKGRTGGVYEAEDTVLGRRVAMRRFYDTEGDSDHTGWEDQFVEIATSLCAIQHPGIATVYDAGVDDDGAYIISQLLSGEPLSDRLQQGPINEWDVYQMTEGILDAMSVAHEAGFIHGAFNPSSIMRVPRASGGYRNLIVDMGLNRLAPLIQGADSSFALMAEPTMMAPEQFDGTPATVQSDLYMVGQFTYICLIGGHPFGGKSLDEAEEAHRSEQLRPLYKYDSGVSRELSDWVDKLIEKDPAKRPQTVREAMECMPRLKKPGDYNKRSQVSGAAPSNLSNGPATSLTEGNKSATATTHLNAPTLKAAASLNMGTAAPLARQTTAQVARDTTAVQHSAAPAGLGGRNPGLPSLQQKKSNVGLVVGIIAGVALLVGGIIVATSGSSTPPDDTTNTDKSEDTENPVIKTPKVIFSAGAKFAKPVFVAKLGSNKESAEIVNLSGVQDWLCVRAKGKGTQPWKITKKDGLYLSGVQYHGGTRGVPHDFYSVGFKDAAETYFSKLLVSSMNSNLKEGGGFRVLGQVPRDHTGALKGRVYFTSYNAKVQVDYHISGRTPDATSYGYYSPSAGEVGACYFMDFECSNPEPGSEFEVIVFSRGAEKAGKVASLILNGIVIK